MMTGRRCNGSGSSTESDGSGFGRSLISDRGYSSSGSNSSPIGDAIVGSNSKQPPTVTSARRCDTTKHVIAAAIVRPSPGTGGAAPAAMHVKKRWKNATVMLLAVAVITTATAAFYFNYSVTATCCAVALPQSSSVFLPPSNPATNPATNPASDMLNRGKFGSSVLHESKLYAVCKTHNYRQDRFHRSRRQTATDSTSDSTFVVKTNSAKLDAENVESDEIALIYFITPTYPRREQVAELTRLGQTLMHIARLHWIVADDRPDCSAQIMNLLPDFGIPYTYVASPMPSIYKRKTDAIPRGVSNRRAALNWIRLNHNIDETNAVIYFGDDDNTFHLDLFNEIRTTKKISMFPVGLVGEYGVSSPIVDNGKVVGFFDSWPAKRKFPVDMAGFAINVQLLFQYPYATMPYKAGFEEDRFLTALAIRLDDIEPKANNCTRILVWHTQTAKKPMPIVMIKSKATLPGSLATLLDQVTILGVGGVSETTGVRSYMTKNGNIYKL